MKQQVKIGPHIIKVIVKIKVATFSGLQDTIVSLNYPGIYEDVVKLLSFNFQLLTSKIIFINSVLQRE